MLTVFFPIPTSNKCCCFTAPMSPPGLVLGHRKPLGLQPHPSSSCPELDFVENLTCFPVQKHNILGDAQPLLCCGVAAQMSQHKDQPHHPSKARSKWVQGPQGPAPSSSPASHHSPGEIRALVYHGPALSDPAPTMATQKLQQEMERGTKPPHRMRRAGKL